MNYNIKSKQNNKIENVIIKGEQGEKGDKGPDGVPGLPRIPVEANVSNSFGPSTSDCIQQASITTELQRLCPIKDSSGQGLYYDIFRDKLFNKVPGKDISTITQEELNKTDIIKIVDKLPTTGLKNRIYLVPVEASTTGRSDKYNEYVYANEKWEKINEVTLSKNIDYSLLVKKNEVEPKLSSLLNSITIKAFSGNNIITEKDEIVFNKKIEAKDMMHTAGKYGVYKISYMDETPQFMYDNYSFAQGVPNFNTTPEFVKCYPWNSITEVQFGDNVFIKIPKFYYRYKIIREKNYFARTPLALCISKYKLPGYRTLFCSDIPAWSEKEIPYILIGKYKMGFRKVPGNKFAPTSCPGVGERKRAIDIIDICHYYDGSMGHYHNYGFRENTILQQLFLMAFGQMSFGIQSNLINRPASSDYSQRFNFETRYEDSIKTKYLGVDKYKHFNFLGIVDIFGAGGTLVSGVNVDYKANYLNCMTALKDIPSYHIFAHNSSAASVMRDELPLIKTEGTSKKIITEVADRDPHGNSYATGALSPSNAANVSSIDTSQIKHFLGSIITSPNIQPSTEQGFLVIGQNWGDESLSSYTYITKEEEAYGRLCWAPQWGKD